MYSSLQPRWQLSLWEHTHRTTSRVATALECHVRSLLGWGWRSLVFRQLPCYKDVLRCLVKAKLVVPKPCRRYVLLGKPRWEAGKEGGVAPDMHKETPSLVESLWTVLWKGSLK